ncbi:hypothetical protein [Anaeromyxobacter dehalogenans]|nr:hypothetical protein [Anaeromyxobacter dehalogenans]
MQIAKARDEVARLERQLDALLHGEDRAQEPAVVSKELPALSARDVEVLYHPSRAFGGGAAREVSVATQIVKLLDEHPDETFSPSTIARALGLPRAGSAVRVALHRLRQDGSILSHGRGEFCSRQHQCEVVMKRN